MKISDKAIGASTDIFMAGFTLLLLGTLIQFAVQKDFETWFWASCMSVGLLCIAAEANNALKGKQK